VAGREKRLAGATAGRLWCWCERAAKFTIDMEPPPCIVDPIREEIMQTLFEYVIIHHPKKKRGEDDSEESVKTALLKDVTRVFAKTEQEVVILAAREIPSDYLDKLDQVQIKVRPF
jgi:hypothetical protein